MKKTMPTPKKKLDSARRIIIESRLRSMGLGVNGIAQSLSVSSTLISLLIDGRYQPNLKSSQKHEQSLASILGMDSSVLFNSTYQDSCDRQAG